jgi:hypothetical protein
MLGEETGCPVRFVRLFRLVRLEWEYFFNPPKRLVQFRTPVSSSELVCASKYICKHPESQ